MTHSEPHYSNSLSRPVDSIYETILSVMLPFHLAAAAGKVDLARAAIRELIDACRCATVMELDLAGRMLAYSAAATDNLRRSMHLELSDTHVLRFRASAVALGRSAEQCRKALQAMQTQREHTCGTEALENPPPTPVARPAPAVPPPPAAPPRETPPPQPRAAVPPDRPLPVPGCLARSVNDDPAFAVDIDVMKRNVTAMLADLRAGPQHPGLGAAEPPALPIRPQRSHANLPTHATVA